MNLPSRVRRKYIDGIDEWLMDVIVVCVCEEKKKVVPRKDRSVEVHP